jgi:soluble lytic murein transglycosylase
MARVPSYDSLQVAATGAPSQSRLTVPDTSGIGGATAQQATQMGNAMQQAGEVAGRIATDIQDKANQVQVDSALNSVKEAQMRLTFDKDVGFTSIKGESAFKRTDGKSLAESYGEKLNENIVRISDGLGNDRQRQMFNQHAAGMQIALRERATQHEVNEYKNHSLSVADGVVKTAVDEIALDWRNPDAVSNAVNRIEAETYRKSILLGKSGEEATADAKRMMSHGHKVAILSALEQNDPAFAADYFARVTKAGQITGDDSFAVRGHITREMDHKVGVQRADQAFAKFAPKLTGGPMETIVSITLGSESGGRRYGVDGKMLESPKGAKGEMQVLDGTNTNPGFGVTPAKDDSPDERARVGRDYLQAMLQRYGGDAEKMWAAYNAGPGVLDKALAAEEKNKKLGKLGTLVANDPSIARTWLDYLPDETQKYVAKNKAALDKAQKGGSAIAKPTLQDIHQELAADPLLAGSPERMKVAMSAVKQKYTDMDAAIKQRGDEVKLSVQQALIENGGNWNALSPTVRAQVAQYIPGDIDNLQALGSKIATGQPVVTDWKEYTNLRAMAATAPAVFSKTNLMLYYDKLAPTQREQLLDLQTKLQDPKNVPDIVTISQQLATAHNLLTFGSGDHEKKGKFDTAVVQEIAAETRAKGRDLVFEERDKIIKRLMLKTDGGWFSTPRLYELAGTPKEASAVVTISSDNRQMMIAALTAKGIPVTEANINSMFARAYGLK